MKKILFVLVFCMLLTSVFAVNTDWGYIKLIHRTTYQVIEGGANTFSLTQARFLVGGDVIKDQIFVAFQAELDSAAINILDAKAICTLKTFKITFGRFLAPFDYYTPRGFTQFNTIEYPILEKFSPLRQEGIMLSYKNDFFSSHLMVSNGNGPNSYEDTDTEKAYLLRMDIKPFKGASIGGSCWYEKFFTGLYYTDFNRANFMFNYRNKAFFFNNQASYIEDEDVLTDANIYSYAYFSHVSIYFGKKFELVTRYEFTNENISVTGGLQTRLTLGFNYNIKGPKAQIAFNYQLNGESEENEVDNDKATLLFMLIL